jgi:hypothetical protein
MTIGVVFVSLAIFFVGQLLVRSIAIGLIFGEPAHANKYRARLRLDFERLFIGFNHFAHNREVTATLRSRNQRQRFYRHLRRAIGSN